MESFKFLFVAIVVLLSSGCFGSSTMSRRGLDGEEREISRVSYTPISVHAVRADEYSEAQIRMGKLPGGEEQAIALQRVRDNNQNTIDNSWQRIYAICMRSHYGEPNADKFCARQGEYGTQFYLLPYGGYYAYGMPYQTVYPLYYPPPVYQLR